MEFGGWVCGAWLFGLAGVFALATRVLVLCAGFGLGCVVVLDLVF